MSRTGPRGYGTWCWTEAVNRKSGPLPERPAAPREEETLKLRGCGGHGLIPAGARLRRDGRGRPEMAGPGEGAKGPDPFFGQGETDSGTAKEGCAGNRFT